jgi:4'-phosphopantetheinyl transferase
MPPIYWLEQTEADVPADSDWLASSERIRMNSLRIPKRRTDWRLGRWTAKRAVALYLQAPLISPSLAEIEIRPAASGAPDVFLAGEQAGVNISLSHRAGTAACAITTSETTLGCDLELIEPRIEAFVTDYFTAEEQALVASASIAGRLWLVPLVWSAKESALKAMRAGLRLDTRSVDVSLGSYAGHAEYAGALSSCDTWEPFRVCFAGKLTFHGWWQRTAGYVRTMVASPRAEPPMSFGSRAMGPASSLEECIVPATASASDRSQQRGLPDGVRLPVSESSRSAAG